MDKTLSQEEVDALLQAIKSGQVSGEEEKTKRAVDEVKVVSYNFRKPHLVSGDQLRGFQLIHESFAKSVQTSLLANLKTPLEIKPVAIDNLSYGEFILSLLSPTFMAVLSTSPNMGDLVIEMNLPVVLSMIDILLGGEGTEVPEPRELTAIEQSIASNMMEYMLTELKAAWSNTVDITYKLQSVESNPEYVRVTTPESSILSATFDLRMGEISGTMNICYPFEMIQPVLDRVTARMSGRREKAAGAATDKEEMLRALQRVPLNLRAEIGRSSILASQLGKLKPGDVICLDKRIDSAAEVFIANRCCYKAEIGARRGKVAVKLVRRYSELEDSQADMNPSGGPGKK
mgnify:CR=1 FL=1